MIHLLYCEHTGEPDRVRLDHFLNQLPQALQEKNRRLRTSEDALNHLTGLLLLKEALHLTGLSSFSWNELKYTTHQRPYFDSGVDFNIAHSGSLVVCAISNEWKVGVDAELIRPLSIERFRSQFTEGEWQRIHKGSDPVGNFFRHWTEKEAVVKAIGVGLAHPLDGINPANHQFTWENESWHTKEVSIDPRYSIHICSNDPQVEITIRKLRLEEMIDA